ncbi:hypothetical protein AGMMS50262_20290 [Bacteroidia bacterium]|nr:hypothetical protein AGMMS50262_20290 [Bacteroidia bacterium]
MSQNLDNQDDPRIGKKEKRVSELHRAATTNYLCCDQTLEDSKGADRVGLTQRKGNTYFLICKKFFGTFFAVIFLCLKSILCCKTYKIILKNAK